MWSLHVFYKNNWIEITGKSSGFSWTSDSDSLGVEFTFDTLYELEEGTSVLFYKDTFNILTGIILKKSEKSNRTYSYTALDYGFYINSNKVLKQFNNISCSKAISQLCDELGIKNSIANIPVNITKVYQDSVSSIIDDLLDQAKQVTGLKYIKYMEGNIFHIDILDDMKVNCKFLVGKDITINGTIEKLKNSVIVVSSENENYNVIAAEKDDNSISKYGMLQDILTVDEKTIGQAKNIALNHLKENNKVFKDMTINLLGLENCNLIKANRLIYIYIKERNISGWYRVKSVSNTVNNNTHKLSVTIEY